MGKLHKMYIELPSSTPKILGNWIKTPNVSLWKFATLHEKFQTIFCLDTEKIFDNFAGKKFWTVILKTRGIVELVTAYIKCIPR